jgi:hypothetical protein
MKNFRKFAFYPLLVIAISMSVYAGINSIKRAKTEKMLTQLQTALRGSEIEYGFFTDGTVYFMSDKDIKGFEPSVNGKKMKKGMKYGKWIWTN